VNVDVYVYDCAVHLSLKRSVATIDLSRSIEPDQSAYCDPIYIKMY